MKNKNLMRGILLCSCAANLLAFLAFFIPNYVLNADTGFFEYVRIFYTRFIEFLLPAIFAVVIACLNPNKNIREFFALSAFAAATRLIFTLPYYYLYFIAYGYDTPESLGLSTLVSLSGMLLTMLQISLFCHIFKEFCYISLRKKASFKSAIQTKTELYEAYRSCLCEEGERDGKASDMLRYGITAVVVSQAVISFIGEMIDTVDYLLGYAGYYRIDDLIYIMICYLFIVAEMVVAYLICCNLKPMRVFLQVCAEKEEDKNEERKH